MILPRKLFRVPAITLCTSLAACAIFALSNASTFLQYNVAALRHGQLWRLFTCHFTHFSASHLFWSGLAFLVLGATCELRDAKRFVVCCLSSALLISLGVWWMLPAVTTYRGLSGIDSALFTLSAVTILRDSRHGERRGTVWVVIATLIAFGGKIVFEFCTDRCVFVSNAVSFAPVPLAHLIGAIVGAGCGFLHVRKAPAPARSGPLSLVLGGEG
ncbi:MAG TPA: rhombosortase [Tepidisphaeraceae bacterium]|nr:rhombosortase [Tepidisphaeraceae bacterium]